MLEGMVRELWRMVRGRVAVAGRPVEGDRAVSYGSIEKERKWRVKTRTQKGERAGALPSGPLALGYPTPTFCFCRMLEGEPRNPSPDVCSGQAPRPFPIKASPPCGSPSYLRPCPAVPVL